MEISVKKGEMILLTGGFEFHFTQFYFENLCVQKASMLCMLKEYFQLTKKPARSDCIRDQ